MSSEQLTIKRTCAGIKHLTPIQLERLIWCYYCGERPVHVLKAGKELRDLGLVEYIPVSMSPITHVMQQRVELTDAGIEFVNRVDKLMTARICAKYDGLNHAFRRVVTFLTKEQLPEFLVHESQVIRHTAAARMDKLEDMRRLSDAILRAEARQF